MGQKHVIVYPFTKDTWQVVKQLIKEHANMEVSDIQEPEFVAYDFVKTNSLHDIYRLGTEAFKTGKRLFFIYENSGK